MSQKQYKPHYLQLKKKWLDKQKDVQKTLWEEHKESLDWLHKTSKHAIVGSLASVLLMAHPVSAASIAQVIPSPDKQMEDKIHNKVDKKSALMQAMISYLPQEVQPLTADQENMLEKKMSDLLGMKISAELEGKRLNRNYGLIGAEQHLMRYNGDTMATHFDNEDDAKKYYSSGMAPGRGAWGYFMQGDKLTQKDIEREKYYIAVPTFLSPGYNDNVRDYYTFFKFHKMIVVNPENGKAMVAVIGDSGPAPFTGKHLGGSPEVMKYLERVDGAAKGPVVYFFIDDPEDKIPLGPIDL
jgi:hypothetical protein